MADKKLLSFKERGISVVIFVEYWDWIEGRGFMRVDLDAIDISHAYDPYAYTIGWLAKNTSRLRKVKLRDSRPFGVETSKHTHTMDTNKFRALVARVNGAEQ